MDLNQPDVVRRVKEWRRKSTRDRSHEARTMSASSWLKHGWYSAGSGGGSLMGDTTAAGMGMRACEEDGRWKGVIAAAEDLLPKVEEKLEKMLVICMGGLLYTSCLVPVLSRPCIEIQGVECKRCSGFKRWKENGWWMLGRVFSAS